MRLPIVLYAETNLVLELSLAQTEVKDAEALLSLSEAGSIRLFLPAFSLGEQHEAIKAKWKQRIELAGNVASTVGDVARSLGWEEKARSIASDFSSLLVAKTQDEEQRYPDVLARISRVAELIPISERVILRGEDVQKASGNVRVKDSLVIATVLDHLVSNPRANCFFVSRDAKLVKAIRQQLEAHSCRCFSRFETVLDAIRASLGRAG